MKKSTVLVLLLLFVALTILRSDLILNSYGSLISSVLLGISGSLAKVWGAVPDLAEFWVAAIVWTVLGHTLVRRLWKKSSPLPKKNLSFIFLAGIAIVTAVVPFLIPVAPEAQGGLMTTRLLRPGTLGTKSVSVQVEIPERTGPVESLFKTTRTYLTGGEIKMEAGRSPGSGEGLMIFLLGTDDTGRDVFSRLLAGGRVSLLIGGLAALGSMFIGLLAGFFAGYSGRLPDLMLMRFTDLMLSIPTLFLVVGCVAFLGQSAVTLVVILALTGWMGVARTVRTEVMKLKEKEFVLAARMLHQTTPQILWRHILPNIKPVLVSAAVLQFGNAVLAEASLSFLGLGVQPPTPTWGNMLGESLGYIKSAWWLAVFPGAMLSSVLLAAHTLGESGTTRQ